MDENTTVKPARAPERTHPARRRTHKRHEQRHLPRHVAHPRTEQTDDATEHAEPQLGGGGASGGGPRDDDDGGRKPDRDGNDVLRLIIALGIVALGAGVMGARRLGKAGRAPHIF